MSSCRKKRHKTKKNGRFISFFNTLPLAFLLFLKGIPTNNSATSASRNVCVSVGKVVNPLGTVTTIIETSDEINDEVNRFSEAVESGAYIHENCDEAMFRPYVTVISGTVDDCNSALSDAQQQIPMPIFGQKLIVPVIDGTMKHKEQLEQASENTNAQFEEMNSLNKITSRKLKEDRIAKNNGKSTSNSKTVRETDKINEIGSKFNTKIKNELEMLPESKIMSTKLTIVENIIENIDNIEVVPGTPLETFSDDFVTIPPSEKSTMADVNASGIGTANNKPTEGKSKKKRKSRVSDQASSIVAVQDINTSCNADIQNLSHMDDKTVLDHFGSVDEKVMASNIGAEPLSSYDDLVEPNVDVTVNLKLPKRKQKKSDADSEPMLTSTVHTLVLDNKHVSLSMELQPDETNSLENISKSLSNDYTYIQDSLMSTAVPATISKTKKSKSKKKTQDSNENDNAKKSQTFVKSLELYGSVECTAGDSMDLYSAESALLESNANVACIGSSEEQESVALISDSELFVSTEEACIETELSNMITETVIINDDLQPAQNNSNLFDEVENVTIKNLDLENNDKNVYVSYDEATMVHPKAIDEFNVNENVASRETSPTDTVETLPELSNPNDSAKPQQNNGNTNNNSKKKSRKKRR